MVGLQCLRAMGFRKLCAAPSYVGSIHCRNHSLFPRRWYSQENNGNGDDKVVNIGCASGFWGDTAVAAPQLIFGSKVNYIVFDYLSEITMSLLTAARRKNPDMGYVPDFVQVTFGPFVKDIKNKGIKLIANAGGINPSSCSAALQKICQAEGVDLKIAVIKGDDLMPQLKDIRQRGICDMDSENPFPSQVQSMNAYLGAGPIARALDMGADVVITGRCTDSALVLGPLIHEFGWKMDQFDLLASGSLAGHLIECGAQATGGISTDWDQIHDWDQIGFPIVSVHNNGNFTLSKPPKTGGVVNKAVVGEQLLYEIGDPCQYFLPDVVCDFSQVSIDEVDKDVVLVQGARGNPTSGEYKVCATYPSGFRSTAAVVVGGPRATEKAEKTAKAVLTRCSRIFHQLNLEDFTEVHTEIIGRDRRPDDKKDSVEGPKDVVLWLAVTHQNRKALEFFSRELAPAGTGMAPGLCGIVGGRPRISPILRLYSFLYPKDNCKIMIEMNEQVEDYIAPEVPTAEYLTQAYPVADSNGKARKNVEVSLATGTHSYRLEELAYTRSGDKGDHCNIGVIARHPVYLPFIKKQLTAEAVEKYFQHYLRATPGQTNPVKRYDVPGIGGFNFLLKNSLGGGGIASLRSDPQGKAMGQELLDFRIYNVPDLKKLAKEFV